MGINATYSAGAGWSFSFSPSGFLATAALTAYDRWSACTAEDAKVSLAKGERLCHYVGERCAKKTPGLGCTERHQVYVCFNSRLSKTINEAAHQQLGLSWGTPEASIARGLTMEEIEKLDFTQIDFTDFVNDVMKSVTNRKGEDPTLAAKNAAERIRQMVAGEISRWAPTRKATGTVPTATTPTHPKGK
ncbi:MAG: conjugal transfer protein TraN [Sutterella sp.]